MADPRPLRDVFTDLVGEPGPTDPAALLSGHGHPGLPDDLVAEAVVSYADTAPVEVAEHLAPYVTAHSVVGADPEAEAPEGWLGLLGTAPDVTELPEEDKHFADLDFGTGADEVIEADEIADDFDDELVETPVEPTPEVEDWTLEEESVTEIEGIDGDDDPDDLDDLPV